MSRAAAALAAEFGLEHRWRLRSCSVLFAARCSTPAWRTFQRLVGNSLVATDDVVSPGSASVARVAARVDVRSCTIGNAFADVYCVRATGGSLLYAKCGTVRKRSRNGRGYLGTMAARVMGAARARLTGCLARVYVARASVWTGDNSFTNFSVRVVNSCLTVLACWSHLDYDIAIRPSALPVRFAWAPF